MAAKKRGHSEVSRDHPKPIRFCKVILEDTIENGKLRVPKHFFRNHEKDLCSLSVVILKVPNTDDVWKVSLRKYRNGELWFEKGWKEFASFYSIQLGDFLVFKWKLDKCQFQVLIFSKTMSEKQYPSRCTPVIKVELSDDEDDVPVKEMMPTDHSGNKKSALSNPHPPFKKMKRSTGEASSSKHGEYKSGGKIDLSESRAPQQSSDFASKYPFFQTVIKMGVLIHGILSIPLSFARSNINWKCRKQNLTFVTNNDDRSWPVKLSCNQESMKNNMYGGLLAFLKENFVREGNLCTFELIHSKQMVFRVHIHRGKYEIPQFADSKRPCSSSKMANADMHGKLNFSNVRYPRRPSTEFASEYPFFQANISKTTLIFKRLNVPRTFVRDNVNIEWSHQIVTLETDGGRSWPANLSIYSNQNHLGRLSGGQFQFFLGENNLKEGDSCTFELVKRKNMVFRVSIYRC